MTQIVSKPIYGSPIGNTIELDGDTKAVALSEEYQLFYDDIEEKLNTNLLGFQLRLPVVTVATLPSAENSELGGMVFVSDEVGGPTPAVYTGLNWHVLPVGLPVV